MTKSSLDDARRLQKSRLRELRLFKFIMFETLSSTLPIAFSELQPEGERPLPVAGGGLFPYTMVTLRNPGHRRHDLLDLLQHYLESKISSLTVLE